MIASIRTNVFIRIISLLVVGIGIGLAAWRAETLASQTITVAYNRTLAPSGGLESPIVLETAIVWHPATSNRLIYQPFDDRPALTYEWVTGIPQRIQATPAGETGKYHLLWLTTTGALRRAQINTDGEQTLAPVPVATEGVLAFDAVPLPNNQSLIVWQQADAFANPVLAVMVDEWGRPLNEAQTVVDNAERFAVATDSVGQVHWVWVIDGTLYYRVGDSETTPWSLEIGANQWLEDLVLGINGATVTLLWGLVDIKTPHQTQYSGLTWQSADAPTPFQLPLAADTPQRWLTHVQADVYTLVAYLNGVWRPLLIQGEDVTVLGTEPALAAPPHVWLYPDGKLNAAWGTLGDTGEISVQMTSTLYTRTITEARPTLAESLLAGILQVPLVVGWLLMPVLMLAVWPRDQLKWLVPSALMVYWGSKLVWPSDLLNVPLMLDTHQPRLVVAALLMLATLGGMAASLWARPARARLLWFWVGDAIITVVMFGINRS